MPAPLYFVTPVLEQPGRFRVVALVGFDPLFPSTQDLVEMYGTYDSAEAAGDAAEAYRNGNADAQDPLGDLVVLAAVAWAAVATGFLSLRRRIVTYLTK